MDSATPKGGIARPLRQVPRLQASEPCRRRVRESRTSLRTNRPTSVFAYEARRSALVRSNGSRAADPRPPVRGLVEAIGYFMPARRALAHGARPDPVGLIQPVSAGGHGRWASAMGESMDDHGSGPGIVIALEPDASLGLHWITAHGSTIMERKRLVEAATDRQRSRHMIAVGMWRRCGGMRLQILRLVIGFGSLIVAAPAQAFQDVELAAVAPKARSALGAGFTAGQGRRMLTLSCAVCAGRPSVSVQIDVQKDNLEAEVRSGRRTIADLDLTCRQREPSCRMERFDAGRAVGWLATFGSNAPDGAGAGATLQIMRDGQVLTVRSHAATPEVARENIRKLERNVIPDLIGR
jgi:hypothetical protein